MKSLTLITHNRRLIYAAMVLLLIIYCGQAGRVEYYRHLRAYKIDDPTFSYSVPPEEHRNTNCFEVTYDSNDRIIKAVYLRDGRAAVDPVNGLSRIEIKYHENKERLYEKDIEGESVHGDIDFFLYEYNNDGDPVSMTNYSSTGEIIEDSSGVARYVYVKDTLRKEISELRLDVDGDTIMDYNLNYKIVYEYNESGNIIQQSYYSRDNCLATNIDQIAIVCFKYDHCSNRCEYVFYDEFEQRTIGKASRASKIKHSFDRAGNIERVELFGVNDKPIFNDSLGFASCSYEFDERGNLKEVRSYDDHMGHMATLRYDDSNRITERITYSADLRAEVFRDESCDYSVVKYDDMGNPIEYSFHDSAGNPVEISQGAAIIKSEYDERGNKTEDRYYAADGSLTEDRVRGFAIVKYEYDKFGENCEVAFYGTDGKPKNEKTTGVAKYVSKRDDGGNVIEISYYDADGKLRIPNGEDCAMTKNYFDEENRYTGTSFHRENDELVMSYKDGFAYVKFDYDMNGLRTKVSYYNEDCILIVNRITGFAIMESVMDSAGEIISLNYYDADRNLIEDPYNH